MVCIFAEKMSTSRVIVKNVHFAGNSKKCKLFDWYLDSLTLFSPICDV